MSDLKPELFKNPPMAHQLEALRRMKGRAGFMLSAEQGTGKTFIDINESAQLWGEGQINGWLVFADNGVHTNWVEIELPKHIPDWVRWRAVAWNANALAQERAAIESIMGGQDSSELRIFCVNYEALVFPRSKEMIRRFCNSVTRLKITCDESQGVANPQTARVKELEKIKAAALVRRCMTGTPSDGTPFSLFSQYRFLDESILRTSSYVAYKAEYADMIAAPEAGRPRETDRLAYAILAKMPKGARMPQVVQEDPITGLPMYKNLSRLKSLIEPHTFRVLKSECLDLPPKVYTQTFFELEPAQRKVYAKMEQEFRYVMANEETAVAKLVALGKLTQITSGFLMHPKSDTDKKVVVDRIMVAPQNPKLKLLKERLEQSIGELGNKVIVWCRYTEEIEQIEELLEESPWDFVSYHGATPKEMRTLAIDLFQNNPHCKVFLVQTQTGSTGITLHAAAHVIYYSNTFSYIDRSQSEDRAHRIGQTKSVLYEDLVAHGTRDMKVVEVLRNKKDIATEINGDAVRRALLAD